MKSTAPANKTEKGNKHTNHIITKRPLRSVPDDAIEFKVGVDSRVKTRHCKVFLAFTFSDEVATVAIQR